MELKKRIILNSSFPEGKDEIFRLFKRLNLNTEIEGIGYYTSEEGLTLWLGNIADFIKTRFPEEDVFSFFKQDSSVLIKHKSSVYLASLHKVEPDKYIILYRLMAFIPEFKTPYLKEFHFLKQKLLTNCAIDYHDFREDVSGFDKLFSRHDDEYFAQPGPQDEIRTYLFPLRNDAKKIVATVSLYPPTLSAKLTTQKENFLLICYLLLGFSLLSLLIHCVKSPLFYKERKPLAVLLVILILVGLRLIFFPLGNLEKIQSLPIFSPASASFFSIWVLTKSPADIFLTAFFLLLIAGCLGIYSRNLFEDKRKKDSLLSLPIILAFIFTSLFFIFVFQELLFRLVSHSNINLLRFSLNPSFFLLHLSIFLFLCVTLFAIFAGMRIISLHSPKPLLPLIILIVEYGVYLFLFKGRNSIFLFTLQFLIIILALFISFFPKFIRRKEVMLSALLLPTLFIYASLHFSASSRNNSLLQNSLQNIIKSQEPWGFFILNQSFPEVDKREEAIISFLQGSEPSDFAHSLWERTLPAKFNWYSSLEIIDPEGEFLSRFSLNVPELYDVDFDLPISRDWAISYLNIPIMGEERDFLLGYKDWFREENHLGRTILYLSIDYDMLPFLYSANPYFELLRVTSIPSLNRFDLGFAIFDPEGRLIFNPNNISSGIPPAVLEKIDSQDSLWSVFTDKRKKFRSFYFKKDHRIYSLFIPKKNFFNFSTEFMRLFFFYLAISLLFFILFAGVTGKRFKNPLWSFSNRVYISFVAIALIPLLLFTFLTRTFFAQIFTQQFTEKAEIHANFVRRVMEDFMITQQEEMVSLITPPENVVLEISSIISSDVNLYQDGRITSSSRREFFDSGLLPDLIDGEIYYKIQYENNPYYTQTQKIGDYSFHTLTTSYSLGDSLLLISLPFPLEQQEISKATEDLIEFLFLISVFFIAVVLVFARGIGHMIVTPIRKLLMGTKEVSSGNLEISIPHKPQDEMKTLIDGFNAMIKNLKKHQQELTDMGKKVAWAEMARKVAHEIKNPLTPIQLSAEHLLRVYKDKKKNFDKALQESASYIITEVENLRKIAQEFLETSKEIVLQKEPFDLKNLVQETIAPYKNMISERIKFKERYEGQDFHIVGDRSRMMIALRNIFINAIEAIQGKGEIDIIVSEEKDSISLEIKDTGIGIGKEMLDRIFESNFSTKDMGTGLGLPISKKIIEEHGGSIRASSKEREGTQIFIDLPK
ncbi:MAG: HAMP domain-containing protein [Candidatus Aminicenantes bacterium]|nr:MAG: HAMP domain-containing protein [Candidatus Aminicenantes bacterium]